MSYRLSALGLVASLIAAPTYAGGPTVSPDDPAPAVALASQQDWSGIRIGLSAAMASGDVVWHTDTFNGGGDSNPADWEGTSGRLALGYDLQKGAMVYGVELAYSSGSIEADIGTDNAYFACSSSSCGTVVSNLLEVRGRVGRAYGKSLFFVVAGYAQAEAEGTFGLPQAVLGSGSLSGYSLGAGMEFAISSRLSVLAEYSHVTLERLDLPTGCTTCSVKPDFGSLRLGVNLRF